MNMNRNAMDAALAAIRAKAERSQLVTENAHRMLTKEHKLDIATLRLMLEELVRHGDAIRDGAQYELERLADESG